MKKFGYFVIGILTLCMTVTQGETKVIAQNTDRGGKVKTEHYYTKKKKNVEFRDIGGGYSRLVSEKDEYKVTKGKYRIIKKVLKGYNNSSNDKLIIEDLKGNILFQTYDMGFLKDVAIGKNSFYYLWDGSIEEGLYKVKLPSGERSLIYPESTELYFREIHRNYMYMGVEAEGNYIGFLNLKNGKYKEAENYFIKGKTLYYCIREEGGYERKVYRCNLDFTKHTYLGKYKDEEPMSHGKTSYMVDYDGKYLYFEDHYHYDNTKTKYKFKLIKNTKK